MSKNRYTDEFKIEAARQVAVRACSVAELAEPLGTMTHSLYAWVKKFGPKDKTAKEVEEMECD